MRKKVAKYVEHIFNFLKFFAVFQCILFKTSFHSFHRLSQRFCVRKEEERIKKKGSKKVEIRRGAKWFL